MKEDNKIPVPQDIPRSWLFKELGEVANVNMGQSPSSTAYNEDGIGKYLIQGNADLKGRKTLPRIWTTDFPKTCAVGDIIMTVRAPVGAVARSLHEACIGRGVCAITTDVLNLDYLYHYLVSYEAKWKALEQGSTFTAVNGKDIRSIQVFIPPLPEQQKIADVLTTVDEKIEVIAKETVQMQELKKGLMQRLFTKGIGHTKYKDSPLGQIPESWQVVLLDKVSKRGSGHTPNKNFPEYYDGGIKWISLGDSAALDNRWIDQTKIEISEEGIRNSSATLHPRGTVLMSRDAGVGKSAVMHETMAVSQHFITWTCGDKLDKWFLYYYLQLQKPLFERIAVGSTIKTIGLPFFKKLSIPLPPTEEQIKISATLYAVDDKIDVLKEKKSKYQELKKGLMQQLFTGKLRVKMQETANVC